MMNFDSNFSSLLNQRSVPWLRKTEYISTEQSSIKSSLKLGEARYAEKEDIPSIITSSLDRVRQKKNFVKNL